MKWIIESNIFECESNLIFALNHFGIPFELISPSNPDFLRLILDTQSGNPHIFMGGIRTAINFYRNQSLKVQNEVSFSDFEWANYGWALGHNSLNRHHILTTVGQLLNDWWHIQACIMPGKHGIFIKPNSSKKPFIAQVVTAHDAAIEALKGLNPSTILMVSSAQIIKSEYRFVVGNGKILAGSQYMDGPNIKFSPQYPTELRDFAQKVVSEIPDGIFQDPFYTIDVAIMEDGDFKVVEINSLFTADWYSCDACIIINEIQKYYSNM